MCTLSDLNEILSYLKSEYQKVYPDTLVRLYLYGSYARGDYTDNSDIDIVAIVKGERKNLQNKLKDIWDFSANMELDYNVIISPSVIPYDEFERYKEILPYYKNIAQEGVDFLA